MIDYDIDFPLFFSRWNNHSMNLVTRFTGLYQSETLVDVTLAAEGKHLQVSFPKQWYFVTKIVLIY